eukprot:scaffold93186_cov31-Tisochrysis_lutea.AAC.2
MAMTAMNAPADPDNSEERKGCSGRVGKMIFSAGVKQLAMVAYVPDATAAKVRPTSASTVGQSPLFCSAPPELGARIWRCASVRASSSVVPCVPIAEWLEAVAKDVKAEIVGNPTKAESPDGGLVACAVVKADPDAGKFPLKDKDTAMASAFAFLRSKVRHCPSSAAQLPW